ncbi:MAG TPA: pirin family protein, partial [Mucilaginibacter sp.]
GTFDAGRPLNYNITAPGNGAFVFILEGKAQLNGNVLNKRDAVGVYNTSSFTIETEELTRFLIIDVPMS